MQDPLSFSRSLRGHVSRTPGNIGYSCSSV